MEDKRDSDSDDDTKTDFTSMKSHEKLQKVSTPNPDEKGWKVIFLKIGFQNQL